MEKKDIQEILERYSSGEFTAEQEEVVRLWLFQLHEDDEAGLSELNLNDASQKIWSRLETITPQPVKVVKLWPRIAVAASIALAVTVGGYFYYNNQNSKIQQTSAYATDVAPGRNSATLTLADGRKIVLSDAVKGKVAEQAGVDISKTSDGEVIYQPQSSSGAAIGSASINVLTTSKGEQYQVVLPDGSKVWLNAASSLKFPASFAKAGQRRVELSGEAYFEITKDKKHPFIVKSSTQEVLVLGTHFNVNAYADEAATRTTLLEGSVNVSPLISKSGKNSDLLGKNLRPGQQAILSGNTIQVTTADSESELAWKNGYFLFNNEDIKSIMRRVSRWYNVEVHFQDEIPSIGFYGSVSRNKNISQVLKMLEASKAVRFKVEGNIVTVLK